MKLVGYCRVSTENQKDEKTIEIQSQALYAYVEARGYHLVEIFSDNGVSGSKDLENRPGLAEMFHALESNPEIEAVLIFKLDRLARDLYIQEHILKKLQDMNKTLISIKEPDICNSDPMRKAFRQFMGVVSELEKAFITMRLSGGRVNKARKAGYAGGSPAYGYTAKDKTLTVDREAADTIRTIFALREQSSLSLREIAEHLNEKGVPSAKGGRWYASTISYMLNNSLYHGGYQYAGVKVARPDLALV